MTAESGTPPGDGRLQETLRNIHDGSGFILVVLAVLLVVPLLFGAFNVDISFMIEMLVFGLATYGVHMLYGYTGLLSFGHAAFFGLGSFIATLMLINTNVALLPIIVLVIVAALLLAVVIGYFSIFQYGIYFAILTLAFAELLRFAALSPLRDITGGQNGLPGAVVRPPLDLFVVSFDLNKSINLYLFIVAITVIWLFVFRRVLYSQVGRTFVAIRENEERARSIGYNVRAIKLISFVISGAITGLAGALYAVYLGFSGVAHLHWTVSGDLLFMTILGGSYNFLGALVGATVFLGLKNFVSAFIEWWPLIVGALFILIIHGAPRGILGTIEEWRADEPET